MAHVGGEAGIALDAQLQGLGHLVERLGEDLEVGVVGGLESRVEATAGDRRSGLGRGSHRADRASRREHSEEDPEPGGDGCGKDQRQPHAAQRGVRFLETERLEVGADAGDVPSDDDVQHVTDLDDLTRRCSLVDDAGAHLRRDLGILEGRRTAGPPPVVPDEIVLDTDAFERGRGGVGGGGERAEVALDTLGVALRGRHGAVDPFRHDAGTREAVGGGGEEHREQQRPEREDQQDAAPKPERAGAGTVDQATEPAALAHVWSRYPSPRTVTTCRGLAGSASTFVRSRRTWTSTSRPSPK